MGYPANPATNAPDGAAATGPKCNAAGAWWYQTVHHMGRRCFNWDYTARCIYEITVVLKDRRRPWLGELRRLGAEGECENVLLRAGWPTVGGLENGLSQDARRKNRANSGRGGAREWYIEPTADGLAVVDALLEMPKRYPQVSILEWQLMPEHIHFMVFVKEPLPKPLGALVRGFKAGAVKRWKSLRENAQTQHPRENAQTQHPRDGARVQSPGVSGAASSRSREECAREEWVGHFAALGNRFLLQRPLAQVQVSRRDFAYRRAPKPGGGLKICRDAAGEPIVDFATPAYAEKKAALFAAARHGAVLISPCVSDGERQIAREALLANLPLVTLQNKGFSKLEKPPGRYFDACAGGRLLMLAPAAWPYQPGEKPMTRFDATAMNRLCQWIAGEGAAKINYHGMKPENIDALAVAAARVEIVTRQ